MWGQLTQGATFTSPRVNLDEQQHKPKTVLSIYPSIYPIDPIICPLCLSDNRFHVTLDLINRLHDPSELLVILKYSNRPQLLVDKLKYSSLIRDVMVIDALARCFNDSFRFFQIRSGFSKLFSDHRSPLRHILRYFWQCFILLANSKWRRQIERAGGILWDSSQIFGIGWMSIDNRRKRFPLGHFNRRSTSYRIRFCCKCSRSCRTGKYVGWREPAASGAWSLTIRGCGNSFRSDPMFPDCTSPASKLYLLSSGTTKKKMFLAFFKDKMSTIVQLRRVVGYFKTFSYINMSILVTFSSMLVIFSMQYSIRAVASLHRVADWTDHAHGAARIGQQMSQLDSHAARF